MIVIDLFADYPDMEIFEEQSYIQRLYYILDRMIEGKEEIFLFGNSENALGRIIDVITDCECHLYSLIKDFLQEQKELSNHV